MSVTRGVSRERLNEIATRKLQSLGIPIQLAPDGQTLVGAITFSPGKLANPINNAPIAGSRFQVVGHDKLQLLDPPLSALPPVEFYDLDRASAIEERLGVALRVRVGYLNDAAGRLQTALLTPRPDPDRLAVVAEVRTPTHLFELLGGPDGIRVARLMPLNGQPANISPDYPPIRLEDFETPTDLELFLGDRVQEMLQAGAAAAAAATAAAAPARLVPVAPAPGSLLVSMLSRLGPDASLSVEGGRLKVQQDFDHGKTRYRFSALYEGGSSFRGRLVGPNGERWSDRFDILRFPGIPELVAMVLEIEPQTATSAVESEVGVSATVPHHLAPHPGEVWVMNVIVEREDAQEVRYACVDANGRPFGAARVVPRTEFARVFAHAGSGWRLLILLDQVQGQTIVYRQLDPNRQPVSEPKAMRIDNLISNFVPEASAY